MQVTRSPDTPRIHPLIVSDLKPLGEPIQSELPLPPAIGRPTEQTAEWFEISPRACFLVDALGRVQVANWEARRVLAAGSYLSECGGRLRFHCAASQRLLCNALAAVCKGGKDRVQRLLRADDAEWRMIWVLPASNRNMAFVALAQSDSASKVIDQLSEAFGFTFAEANVMKLILEDEAPKQVAASLSISTNTVRTHLRSIYSKMNVRGLAQAIRLASRLTTS
ncbi:LuxR C-terminal-related transcriptional regulator [Brevundimonas sp.]|jgi:DNA-binding CsgD family transcriptional regulator|uniref:helix-turn-helix transcriptional regulator n=1 Tax=Brevundimonas sp. TaxID=1871086 RepID=UPI0035683AF4